MFAFRFRFTKLYLFIYNSSLSWRICHYYTNFLIYCFLIPFSFTYSSTMLQKTQGNVLTSFMLIVQLKSLRQVSISRIVLANPGVVMWSTIKMSFPDTSSSCFFFSGWSWIVTLSSFTSHSGESVREKKSESWFLISFLIQVFLITFTRCNFHVYLPFWKQRTHYKNR